MSGWRGSRFPSSVAPVKPASVVPGFDLFHHCGARGEVTLEVVLVIRFCLHLNGKIFRNRVDAAILSNSCCARFCAGRGCFEDGEDFAYEVPFDAADDVSFAFSILSAVL